MLPNVTSRSQILHTSLVALPRTLFAKFGNFKETLLMLLLRCLWHPLLSTYHKNHNVLAEHYLLRLNMDHRVGLVISFKSAIGETMAWDFLNKKEKLMYFVSCSDNSSAMKKRKTRVLPLKNLMQHC